MIRGRLQLHSGTSSLVLAKIGRSIQSSNYDVHLRKPGDKELHEENNGLVCVSKLVVANVGRIGIGVFLSLHQSW